MQKRGASAALQGGMRSRGREASKHSVLKLEGLIQWWGKGRGVEVGGMC